MRNFRMNCYVPSLVQNSPLILEKMLKCENFTDRPTDGHWAKLSRGKYQYNILWFAPSEIYFWLVFVTPHQILQSAIQPPQQQNKCTTSNRPHFSGIHVLYHVRHVTALVWHSVCTVTLSREKHDNNADDTTFYTKQFIVSESLHLENRASSRETRFIIVICHSICFQSKRQEVMA